MRTLTLLAFACLLSSAFVLYNVKYDTQRLQARIQEQERRIERTVTDIAILKAERAHLSRPERLERLAREELGLRAPKPGQFVRGRDIPMRRTMRSERPRR